MPTALRLGPYRFFFFAGDRDEPPHIHVQRDKAQAKFWLAPLRLQRSKGYSKKEVRRIRRVIEDNQEHLMETWNAYFDQ